MTGAMTASGKSPRNGDDLTSVSETQTQWKLMSAASGFASDKEQRESRSGDQPHLTCPKHFKTPSYSFYLDVREQVGMEVCLNHGYFSLFKMDVQTDHTPLKGDN